MTHLDELIRLIPPPADPVEAHGDWDQVEAALGLSLPADYKGLVQAYGTGTFVDFITPLRPFGASGYCLLLQEARGLLDRERSFRDEYPEQSPYPYYPEPGGLLEWAVTGNGDYLCWLTAGRPDSCTTVAWNPRGSYYDAHSVGAVEFLHGWITGRISTTVFGDADDPDPWFEPFREITQVSIRLTEGDLPYEERLRILHAAFAPTADRGGYNRAGRRQDHFAATDHGWRFTYETAYGHQLRIEFPRDDEDRARLLVLDAIDRIGCQPTKMVGGATTDWGIG